MRRSNCSTLYRELSRGTCRGACLLAIAALVGCAADASSGDADRPDDSREAAEREALAGRSVNFADIKVYSRNTFLGADLAPVLAAQSAAEFVVAAQTALTEVALNNFPARVEVLADEIAASRPHLIGLQEMFNFTVNGQNGPPPFRDHLGDLLAALEARGQNYVVAGTVFNLNLSLPIDITGDQVPELIGVTDSDVILARADVATTAVPLCAEPSGDGCNFTVNLPLDFPDPLPDSSVFRGYVAVDAEISGTTVRFVNTHLEVRGLGDIDTTLIQAAQAQELLAVLDAATPAARPIILVGDINSAPDAPLPSPYAQIASSYQDTWDRNILKFLDPEGLTCCQAADLDDTVNDDFDERIDVVFVKNNLGFLDFNITGPVFGFVLGAEQISDTRPKWASDHAGPLVRLPLLPSIE